MFSQKGRRGKYRKKEKWLPFKNINSCTYTRDIYAYVCKISSWYDQSCCQDEHPTMKMPIMTLTMMTTIHGGQFTVVQAL